MPRLGVQSLAFTPVWSPSEADHLLPPLAAEGVSVVEIPMPDPRVFDAAATRQAAARNGVEIVCSLSLPPAFDVAGKTSDAVDYLDAALNAARNAGASLLTGMTYGTRGRITGAPPTQGEQDALCQLVDRVARKARDVNMRLGLEPANRYETHLLNTARQAAEIIERVGAEGVVVHLDTFHMALEEVGMAQGFEDAGAHLGYVQLSEANLGVPGRGTLDWDAVFGGLKDVGYAGVMTLECPACLTPGSVPGLWRPVAVRPAEVVEIGIPFLRDKADAAGLVLE